MSNAPTNFQHVTLAMDLSLSQPGFAVLAVFDGQPIVLEVSHVKTNAKQSHGYRLYEIADEISRLIVAYMPEHFVREKGFSRFPATTQTLFKVVGVSDYLAFVYGDDAKVAEIAPAAVKKSVTGDGKASKQDVQDVVTRILQIQQADYFANDDESDACAVAIAYYKQKGLIA